MSRGDEPAYPVERKKRVRLFDTGEEMVVDESTPGLTKRELIAAMAPPCPLMESTIAALKVNDPEAWAVPNWSDQNFHTLAFIDVRWRKAWADILLAELEKPR